MNGRTKLPEKYANEVHGYHDFLRFFRLSGIILLMCMIISSRPADAKESVSLMLSWGHGFQFAGHTDVEKPDLTWFYQGQLLTFMIALIISAIAFYIYRINRRLKGSLKKNHQITVAIAESEELWRTIVKTSPDGIAITSVDGIIQQVSDTLPVMFGFASGSDMVGRNMYDFIDHEFHEMAKSRHSGVLAGN